MLNTIATSLKNKIRINTIRRKHELFKSAKLNLYDDTVKTFSLSYLELVINIGTTPVLVLIVTCLHFESLSYEFM